jgi:hypothetical protein
MAYWKLVVAGIGGAASVGVVLLLSALQPSPVIESRLSSRTAHAVRAAHDLVPRQQDAVRLPNREATRRLREAVAETSAISGNATVQFAGPILVGALQTILPEVLRTDISSSQARTLIPSNTSATLQVRRYAESDASTARGVIRSGFVRVPVTVTVDDAANMISVNYRSTRVYQGSAAGIALDAGRELLEHTELWQTVHGTCTHEQSVVCTIRVRVRPDAMQQHLAREPDGELARSLKALASMDGTATIREGTLIADQWTARDTTGRQLRVSSTYQ